MGTLESFVLSTVKGVNCMFTLKNSKAQAVIVLALVWLGVFIASYAQNQLAGMSTQFMEHYGFTAEQYAAIYSSSQFIGIFFAFVSGILSDKIGTRKIVLIAAAMVFIAAVCRIFAFSFEAQYISNMFCGFTGMFMAVNRAKILGGWFPPATIALAVGIATTTTPVANTLGVGLTSLMPSVEFAFVVTAVIAAVFFFGWLFFGKERSDEIAQAEDATKTEDSGKILKTLIDVLKSPWAWVCCLAAMFCMAAQVPVMAFSTAALQALRGMSPVESGAMITALTIGMGVGSVVSPIIIRAIKKFRPIIAVYTVVTALVIYFAWQMPIGPVMYGVYFCGGFCLGYLLAIIFTYPVMIFGREKAATAGGLVQTFVLIGASLFLTNVTIPLAGGASPDTFPTIFLIATAFIVIGGILLFVLPDQGVKMVDKKKEQVKESGAVKESA